MARAGGSEEVAVLSSANADGAKNKAEKNRQIERLYRIMKGLKYKDLGGVGRSASG